MPDLCSRCQKRPGKWLEYLMQFLCWPCQREFEAESFLEATGTYVR